jgi:hypothetical protein
MPGFSLGLALVLVGEQWLRLGAAIGGPGRDVGGIAYILGVAFLRWRG